jgi:hypothetical protein
MAAIPTSDLPGHKQLHEKVIISLERCQESQSVEFKESATWESLKWRAIQAALAMGNLRDGGLIIIGVSQRGDQWNLTGVQAEHLETYDVDIVTDQINKYASPHVDVDVVAVKYHEKVFLVLQFHEFAETPLVCKKNGAESEEAGRLIREGYVYVRPPGMARTTRITNAAQMAELLQLAAEKRARRILEVSHRIGMISPHADQEKFARELQDVLSQGDKLPIPVLSSPHWEVIIHPDKFEPELIGSLNGCFDLVEQTKVRLRGWDFPHLSHLPQERTLGNNWAGSWVSFLNEVEYWRLYQSGQFIHLHALEEAINIGWRESTRLIAKDSFTYRTDIDWSKVPGFVSYLNCLYRLTEIFEFAARICEKGVWKGSLSLSIKIQGIQGFVLTMDPRRNHTNYWPASESEIGKAWTFETGELVATGKEKSLQAAAWFFERFGWLAPPIDVLRKDQEDFVQGRI